MQISILILLLMLLTTRVKKLSTAAGKQTVKIVEPEKDENTEDGDDDSGVDDLVSEDDEVETVEPVEEDKAEESNDDYSVYDPDSDFDKADPVCSICLSLFLLHLVVLTTGMKFSCSSLASVELLFLRRVN